MLKDSEGVVKANIAYLTDRVAVNEGRTQIYGTQFFTNEHYKIIPRSILDEEKIEEKRKEMGLEPFDIYAQKITSLGMRNGTS